ncbi:unnamed protein product [Amoebophrya sp. A120]|nr:unnamed protein product [Amoebophrya sp. A120]|eukprot:GSA120T00006462001.1
MQVFLGNQEHKHSLQLRVEVYLERNHSSQRPAVGCLETRNRKTPPRVVASSVAPPHNNQRTQAAACSEARSQPHKILAEDCSAVNRRSHKTQVEDCSGANQHKIPAEDCSVVSQHRHKTLVEGSSATAPVAAFSGADSYLPKPSYLTS